MLGKYGDATRAAYDRKVHGDVLFRSPVGTSSRNVSCCVLHPSPLATFTFRSPSVAHGPSAHSMHSTPPPTAFAEERSTRLVEGRGEKAATPQVGTSSVARDARLACGTAGQHVSVHDPPSAAIDRTACCPTQKSPRMSARGKCAQRRPLRRQVAPAGEDGLLLSPMTHSILSDPSRAEHRRQPPRHHTSDVA